MTFSVNAESHGLGNTVLADSQAPASPDEIKRKTFLGRLWVRRHPRVTLSVEQKVGDTHTASGKSSRVSGLQSFGHGVAKKVQGAAKAVSKAVNARHPDGFSAVKADYDRLSRRAQVEGLFNDDEALALRQRLLAYVERKERGGYESREKGQAKLDLADICLRGIDQLRRNHAQILMTAQRPKPRRSELARLAQSQDSPAKRAAHARRWRGESPEHRLSDSTTQGSVHADDGLPVFRLLAMPAAPPQSGAVREATKAALRVAMGAAMHEDVRRQTGIDLCLPRATVADPLSVGEPRVVIVDAVDGSPSPDGQLPDIATLQRAVAGQWMLGRMSPVWSDFGYDANGRFVAHHTALSVHSLSEICDRAERGPLRSGLFVTPDGKRPSELAGQPLDADLRSALLRYESRGGEALVRAKADLATSDRLGRPGQPREQPLGDESVLQVVGNERAAPLQALQRALATSDASTPLEMILADASGELRAMERQFRQWEALRGEVDKPAPSGKARRAADRVRNAALTLWRGLRLRRRPPGDAGTRPAVPGGTSPASGTPLAR